MFAPKVAKQQTKTSTAVDDLARRHRRSPVEWALMRPPIIGNQGMLRPPPHGAEGGLIGDERSNQEQQAQQGVAGEAPVVSRDFSMVLAFSADRPGQAPSQPSLPLRPSVSVGMQAVAEATRHAARENGAAVPPSQSAFSAAMARARMRDDASADRSARLLGAEAVAFGDQVLFRRGLYAPDTEPGRALIAHELTHVAHQGQTGRPYPQRSVGGDVLSVHFTQAMAEAMTGDELDKQMQLLRAHLQGEPGDVGASENLAVLEDVAQVRQGTARQTSPPAVPAPPGQAQPGSVPPTQAPPGTNPPQQAPGGEEQHGKIWWWLHSHGQVHTKHERAEILRRGWGAQSGVVVTEDGKPVNVEQLSDDEVIALDKKYRGRPIGPPPAVAMAPIMTQWGWTGSSSYIKARNVLNRPGTHNDLEGKVPTKEEAKRMIQESGGRVEREDYEGHPPGGVSEHTEPHINYTTAAGEKATIIVK
jgi:hypothetical protein